MALHGRLWKMGQVCVGNCNVGYDVRSDSAETCAEHDADVRLRGPSTTN